MNTEKDKLEKELIFRTVTLYKNNKFIKESKGIFKEGQYLYLINENAYHNSRLKIILDILSKSKQEAI